MNRESSNIPGHLHFLTFSCLKKQRLLTDDQTCLWLAEALDKARRAEEFDLWAYVFMPEHVHLLIRPRRSEYSMAKILRRIKEPFTHRVVRRWTECDQARLQLITTSLGSRALHCFWQPGGGFDRNLRSMRKSVELSSTLSSIRYGAVWQRTRRIGRGRAREREPEWLMSHWFPMKSGSINELVGLVTDFPDQGQGHKASEVFTAGAADLRAWSPAGATDLPELKGPGPRRPHSFIQLT